MIRLFGRPVPKARSTREAAFDEAGPFGDRGEGAGLVSGQVPGVKRGPFRGEASGEVRDRPQLQLGQEGGGGAAGTLPHRPDDGDYISHVPKPATSRAINTGHP